MAVCFETFFFESSHDFLGRFMARFRWLLLESEECSDLGPTSFVMELLGYKKQLEQVIASDGSFW
ncbi:hypothetical protein FRX31_012002 [Thalictrum thalictroides]|uniref:Uncharacterized protein n=1 Tax=Thalictrum thalictroides TaxID=46969 RepID=A0A7J6WPA5_THATH|nr:hypothetical protein FRX31_012002 [Thalictrum thalictroides]